MRQADERGFKVVVGSDVTATDDPEMQEPELKVLKTGRALVRPVGVEPTTHGLKGRRSAIELRTQETARSRGTRGQRVWQMMLPQPFGPSPLE